MPNPNQNHVRSAQTQKKKENHALGSGITCHGRMWSEGSKSLTN
jgi:hypothetical protein